MRIVVINGSPNGRQGLTAQVTSRFLAGARKAGASSEEFYLVELRRFENCRADFACWTRRGGACVIRDDLTPVLDRIRGANIWVIASPLHTSNVSSLTQRFLERLLFFLAPASCMTGGRVCYHPWQRPEDKPQGIVFVSTCTFPGRSNFTGVRAVVEGFAGTLQVPVLAEILMEKARLLSIPGDTGCANFLLTVEAAGEEIGKFLELTPVIRARLQQENPMSPEEYINLLNRYWEQQRE